MIPVRYYEATSSDASFCKIWQPSVTWLSEKGILLKRSVCILSEMAALLCQSLCRLLTDCSACLSYPCKTCCECTGRMICSPFVPYLTVTFAFNIPLALWGYETIKQKAAHCDKVWWLWVNAVMAAFHIVGSIYIVYRIQHNKQEQVHAIDEPYDREAPPSTVLYGHVQAKAFPEDGRSDTVDGTGKSRMSADSREAILKKKKRRAKPVLDPSQVSYRNMDHPDYDPNVTSPRSVTSNTSKSKSIFLNIFSTHKNAAATSDNNEQHHQPTTIQSVASMLAGLPDHPDDGPANSFQRLGQVLCYDTGVALYFFVAVLWVIWQTVGVTVAISLASTGNQNDDAVVYQCDSIKRWILLSTVCGFLYMMLVFFAFGCSLLCLR